MPATLLLESFSVKHTGRRPWAASGLVGREVAHPAVGTLLVVDGDPVGDDDAGLGERVELLAVEALIPEAGVVALDDPVLPGRAGVDGDGLDAVGSHELLDGLGDELRAIVGPDVLGLGLLADHGEIITFGVQHRAFLTVVGWLPRVTIQLAPFSVTLLIPILLKNTISPWQASHPETSTTVRPTKGLQ